MALLLPLISALLLTLVLASRKKSGLYEGITQALLTMSLVVAASSELLSQFNAFTAQALTITWVCILVCCVCWLYFEREGITDVLKSTQQAIVTNKLLSLGLFATFVAVFVQGVVYPPNNWDSMTYHLGRVVHWVSNQNIEAYPTHIYRQIWQPPLSELWLAQVCMLGGSDLYANTVQLFFLIASLACIVSMAKEMGVNRNAIVLSLIFVATTPEIILQGSSTQNDVTAAFFVLCVVRYCYALYRHASIVNAVWLGLSIGLAFYTKGSTYVFILPLLSVLSYFLAKAHPRSQWLGVVTKLGIVAVIALVLNLGYYSRNMELSGSPLGRNDARLFNERYSPSTVLIGITQNLALHCGIDPIAKPAMVFVIDLHKWLGETLGDPAINYSGEKFSITHWNHHEDSASNPLQLVVVFLALAFLVIRRKKIAVETTVLYLLVVAEFIVFCVALKWQPWNSRLHTPIFMMAALPTCAILVSAFKKNAALTWATYTIIGLCVILSGRVIALNQTRPFVNNKWTMKVNPSSDRASKMFINQPEVQLEYFHLKRLIDRHRDSLGLIINEDTWEYPLFDDIYSSGRKVLPHLNVLNYSRNSPHNGLRDTNAISLIIAPGDSNSVKFGGSTYLKVEWLNKYALYSRSQTHPDSVKK